MVAALVGLSAPAFAHHSDASGQTSCADGSHTVTWSISNSESNQQMTIVSATAVIGGQSYAVTGYANPVDESASTTAVSTVPGGTTGTITLSADVSWPDHYTAQASASVDLPASCGDNTTTTIHDNRCDDQHPNEGNDNENGHNNPACDTTTTTSTTQPEVTTTTYHHCECTTSTTQPEVTTTTTHHCGCSTTTTVPVTTTTEQTTTTTTKVHELGSTTIFTTTTKPKATTTLADGSSSTVATTTPVPGSLPFTGGNTNLPVIFGGLCIAAGAALAFRKRGAWSR